MCEASLAVVTGARRGLGKAVLDDLRSTGTRCVTIARVPIDVRTFGHVEADLAQPQDWDGKLAPFLRQARFERLWFFDIAAILPLGEVRSREYGAKLEEAMKVNVTAPLAIGRTLAEAAARQGASLDIVHVSSGAAHRPIARWGAYCVTKAAAAMQWGVFAEEAEHVTAHLIQPGVIDSDMQAQLRAADDPVAAPMAALRSPQEVARDVLSRCGFGR